MNIKICDICLRNTADRKYKIKESRWMDSISDSGWSLYRRIDICNECAKKFFNILNPLTQTEYKFNKK